MTPDEVATEVFALPVLGARVWLLRDEPVTLVDTGTRGSGRAILRGLARLGRRPAGLATVVLTHYHPDHVGALPELLAATAPSPRARSLLRVAIHTAEVPALRAPGRLPNPLQPPLARALVQPFLPLIRLGRPCPVHLPLSAGDGLPGRPDVRVVHLPGHTPGSIALHLPDRGLVLVGDSLERRGGRLGPPNPWFTEDRATALASIRRLASLDFDALALAHFPPIRRHADTAVRALAARH